MKSYTHKEVRDASVEYFKGDTLAADVFASKYALQDLKGDLYEKTPRDMHERLAREFARIESKYPNPLSYEEILSLLSDWTCVPQGGPMSAIGNPFQVQSLSNCFVIESPHDSYGGILKTDQEQVQIMKRRGGVGFDLSTLRPKDMPAANAARTTDGVGVFMERFSNTCREVAQGGRRGALMLSYDVHGCEVSTFVNIKRDFKKVTGANISVRLSDKFMNAVVSDSTYTQRFPTDESKPALLTKEVSAKSVWDEIVDSAWSTAEPGLLMWDTIIKGSPADCYPDFKTISTNPCAELPLPAGDSCRLLLVNVSKFVKDEFLPTAEFLYAKFADAVIKAQRLMDDMIDLEVEAITKILSKIDSDPEPIEIKQVEINLWNRILEKAKLGRRTGLGITALGDAIAALSIRFGSEKSIQVTEKIYKILGVSAYSSSIIMAQERGAFPRFDSTLEKNHVFLDRINAELSVEQQLAHKTTGRRNIALLTTAPAGSVSILTQSTSGCEPVYTLQYKRRKKVNADNKELRVDFVDQLGDSWQEYIVSHPGLAKWSEVTGNSINDIHMSPYHLATSNEIDWLNSVKMQAAAQRWIDHAISRTVNLPESATKETVASVYLEAWKSGCKGITVYRDKSRSGVLVSIEEKKDDVQSTVTTSNAPKRPAELQCDIHRTTIQGETYIVLVGLLDNQPYEVFAGLSASVEIPKKSKHGFIIKKGKNKEGNATYSLRIPVGDDDEVTINDLVSVFDNPVNGAFTRTISLALRHGIQTHYLVEQLKKDKNSDIFSFPNVIARVLSKHYIQDGTKSSGEKKCLECGSNEMIYQQGCCSCASCGWSKCLRSSLISFGEMFSPHDSFKILMNVKKKPTLKLEQLKAIIREEFLHGIPDYIFKQASSRMVEEVRRNIFKHILTDKSYSQAEQKNALREANVVLEELEKEVSDLITDKLWNFSRRVLDSSIVSIQPL